MRSNVAQEQEPKHDKPPERAEYSLKQNHRAGPAPEHMAERALAKMMPDLKSRFDDVYASLVQAGSSDALARYDLGKLVKDARKDTKKLGGESGVRLMAAALRMHRSVLYEYAKVAEVFPKKSVEKLVRPATSGAFALTFYHLIELAQVDDEELRQQLMTEAREERLTVAGLKNRRASLSKKKPSALTSRRPMIRRNEATEDAQGADEQDEAADEQAPIHSNDVYDELQNLTDRMIEVGTRLLDEALPAVLQVQHPPDNGRLRPVYDRLTLFVDDLKLRGVDVIREELRGGEPPRRPEEGQPAPQTAEQPVSREQPAEEVPPESVERVRPLPAQEEYEQTQERKAG